MLDELDQDVDTTHSRLKAAQKKMQELIRKSGSNTQLVLIVVLIVILVVGGVGRAGGGGQEGRGRTDGRKAGAGSACTWCGLLNWTEAGGVAVGQGMGCVYQQP